MDTHTYTGKHYVRTNGTHFLRNQVCQLQNQIIFIIVDYAYIVYNLYPLDCLLACTYVYNFEEKF